MKIHPVRAELFHADGETDMTKLIVALRNFAKASKNSPLSEDWERWLEKYCPWFLPLINCCL